jgi:general secretion pathway protein A
MYEQHFGLTDRPFALTPDPRFWFDTATHRKAMSYLGYGLQQGEGFIVITGDIGAGKTTLVGHLIGRIDPARIAVIKIVSTAVEADDLLRTVAHGLSVEGEGLSKAELLKQIERGLHGVARTGKRILLIVDEAQALPVSALEELRMLSNFQAGGHAMLQILLLGQPEFRDRLSGSDRLEQLRQRVIAVHHLDPMGEDEVAAYIAHRLQVAGWQGKPDFTDDAFPVIHRVSGGVPRRLNQLMGRVLLQAALADADLIDAAMVEAVTEDAERDIAAPPPPPVAPSETAPVIEPAEPEPESEPVAEAIAPAPEPLAPARIANGLGEWIEEVSSSEADLTRRVDDLEAQLAAVPRPDPTLDSRIAALEARDDAASERRIAELENRIAEQDAALRRVLTLLVDWVEGDARDTVRSAA